jgi:hypothetical protein
LLKGLPVRHGTSLATGAALAPDAFWRLISAPGSEATDKPDILIG